jgi:hypothetical protein
MTKTLVERLLDHGRPATETQDRYTIRRNEERAEAAAEITRLASRIEELERALGEIKAIRPLEDGDLWNDGFNCALEETAEIIDQALSEPSPATPVKRIGAARYLEG